MQTSQFYKEVAVSDGTSIKIQAATLDEYRTFIRLSPTLVLGHANLLGQAYLHLFKERGDIYRLHGTVYFNERLDGAVIWSVDLACDVSPELQKQAKEQIAKTVDFANRVQGAAIFIQLVSMADPHTGDRSGDFAQREPATVPTRKPNR